MSKVKVKAKEPKVSRRVVTEFNLRVLKELMTGRYLQGRMCCENHNRLRQALGVSDAATKATLRKLENMGIIVGYIPLLSEEGRRIVDAMRLMYSMSEGMNDKSRTKESLIDMVEEE